VDVRGWLGSQVSFLHVSFLNVLRVELLLAVHIENRIVDGGDGMTGGRVVDFVEQFVIG